MAVYSYISKGSVSDQLILYMGLIMVPVAGIAIFYDSLPILIAIFIGMLIMVAVFHRPIIGVYLLIAIYPIESVYLRLNRNWPGTTNIYPFELLSISLLIVMVLRYLSSRHQPIESPPIPIPNHRWVVYFSAVFIISSLFTLIWVDRFDKAMFGWIRLNCNFILLVFLVFAIDRYEKFVKTLTFFCAAAVFFSFLSIYSGYYAFLTRYELLVTPYISIIQENSLFNHAGGFLPQIIGMVSGFGVSGKHELGMFLLSAIPFGFFLIHEYSSIIAKGVIGLLILLCLSIVHVAFVKLSILGLFLVLCAVCLHIPDWRRRLAGIVGVFILINITAHFASEIIRPASMKVMETVASKVAKISKNSQYQSGSLSERIRIWKRSIERIKRAGGTGEGPDSLEKDVLHGHNFLLTFAADYGILGLTFIIISLISILTEAYRQIFSHVQIANRFWLLKLTLFSVTMCTLFEYLFDCFIWYPQAWFVTGLLFASLRLVSDCPDGAIASNISSK